MNLIPLPAFNDNYFWLLHDGAHAIVVDPGEALVVSSALQRLELKLDAILVTHHHADHVGGVQTLRLATGAQVYGPGFEDIPEPVTRLNQGDSFKSLGLSFSVIDVPGHTSGHIAYYCADAPLAQSGTLIKQQPILFCGDTLFSGGCGRLFEGTPAQMLDSLDKLATLPADTLVCCAHEYTLTNLKFANAVEPSNANLVNYTAHCQTLRAMNLPTLPSTMGLECLINPFLRSRESTIRQSIQAYASQSQGSDPIQAQNSVSRNLSLDDVQAFAILREWKNTFQ